MRSPDLLLPALAALGLAAATAIPRARAIPPPGAGATASASAAPAIPPRAPPTPAGEATNTCLTCHATLTDQKLRAPAKEHRGSVHRDERIGCAGCHRGDPRDPTAGAHARSTGFEPHPTHAEVPGMCGSCHSDAAFMRHMNARLPVGQATLFGLSLHGKRTAAGDELAPSCADCHGKHGILAPSSPQSPVNRANIATLCGGCHSDRKRMARYEIATDQVAKWEKSVHGVAFKKGNPNAPTCTGCHGAHSATPPESSSVGRACGRCHEEELRYFEQSPHSKGFRRRGLAECVACHGNHDIAPPSALIVGTTPDATCTKCHAQDEKPRRVAEETRGLLQGARERADEARRALAGAREAGLHVAGAKLALDRISTAELKLRGVVHTLDPARLEEPVAAVDQAVVEAKGLAREAEALRRSERRGYYVALALAAALFVSLLLKARQLDREPRRGS